MKKRFQYIRDIFVAGVIFLLPVLVIFVLVTKVFQYLTGFTNRIAAIFGLKSFLGVSGGTIVGAIGIMLFCILCGYLVKIAFFKAMSKWLDEKLMQYLPGYSVYREMAMSKLENREEALPYQSALWIGQNNVLQPAFLMEKLTDGRMVVFVPTAGNVKEGAVFIMPGDEVQLCPEKEMRAFHVALSNLGIGLSKLA